MATLRIEAERNEQLRSYTLIVDGHPVPMREDHKGDVAVFGSCGDGSPHLLLYSMFGSAGATLQVRILCGGTEVCATADEIGPAGEPYGAGREDFTL